MHPHYANLLSGNACATLVPHDIVEGMHANSKSHRSSRYCELEAWSSYVYITHMPGPMCMQAMHCMTARMTSNDIMHACKVTMPRCGAICVYHVAYQMAPYDSRHGHLKLALAHCRPI